MFKLVTFESDEAAEQAAVELGAPIDVLAECGSLEALINGVLFEIGVDDSGHWALYSALGTCAAIKCLHKVYPQAEFVNVLRASQQLLSGATLGSSDRESEEAL